MTSETSWKSALKASFVINFVFVIFFSVVFIFVPEPLEPLFKNVSSPNRAIVDLGMLLASVILLLDTFVWALFGKFYNEIPAKSAFAKSFLFNLFITVIWYFVIKAAEPLLEFLNISKETTIASTILMIILYPIAFTQLFSHFEKKRQAILNKELARSSIKRRALAYIIDVIILALVIGIPSTVLAITVATSSYIQNFEPGSFGPLVPWILAGSIFGTVFTMLYWVVFEARYGKTIGKKILRITATKIDGANTGYSEAFFRNFSKFFSPAGVVFILESVLAIFDKNKQRLSDKIADTIVIKDTIKEPQENLVFASFKRRFAARIIDLLVLISITFVLAILVSTVAFLMTRNNTFYETFNQAFVTIIVMLIAEILIIFGYFISFHTVFGQTIGKKVMRIKLIQTNGKKMDFLTALVREIGWQITTTPLFLGLLWIIIDKNKQGLHDKIAQTYVIKVGGKK